MRVLTRSALLTVAAMGVPVSAWALPSPAEFSADDTARVRGEVTATTSRWAGSSIVTESTIRGEDDDEIEVVQLGGSVEGIGMRLSHMPPVLAPGQKVTAELRSARTRKGEPRWTLSKARPQGAAASADDEGLPFVRTITAERTPVEWTSGCALMTYHEDGTTHLPGDNEFSLMDTAFERWERDADHCSYFNFARDGFDDREVAFDGVNMVIFREDRWCRPPADGEPEVCYSASAAGITTLFFVNDPESPDDGEILDADIELNGVDFAISSGGETQGDAGCLADLANTLTHEVGHLLGLDHTCWDGNAPRPRDHNQEPAPECSTRLPEEITEATMYNFQDCGETKKASLTQDDIDGVCEIYPLENDPGTCEPTSVGGCCSVAATGPHTSSARGGAAAALFGLLFLGFVRARSRSRGASG